MSRATVAMVYGAAHMWLRIKAATGAATGGVRCHRRCGSSYISLMRMQRLTLVYHAVRYTMDRCHIRFLKSECRWCARLNFWLNTLCTHLVSAQLVYTNSNEHEQGRIRLSKLEARLIWAPQRDSTSLSHSSWGDRRIIYITCVQCRRAQCWRSDYLFGFPGFQDVGWWGDRYAQINFDKAMILKLICADRSPHHPTSRPSGLTPAVSLSRAARTLSIGRSSMH